MSNEDKPSCCKSKNRSKNGSPTSFTPKANSSVIGDEALADFQDSFIDLSPITSNENIEEEEDETKPPCCRKKAKPISDQYDPREARPRVPSPSEYDPLPRPKGKFGQSASFVQSEPIPSTPPRRVSQPPSKSQYDPIPRPRGKFGHSTSFVQSEPIARTPPRRISRPYSANQYKPLPPPKGKFGQSASFSESKPPGTPSSAYPYDHSQYTEYSGHETDLPISYDSLYNPMEKQGQLQYFDQSSRYQRQPFARNVTYSPSPRLTNQTYSDITGGTYSIPAEYTGVGINDTYGIAGNFQNNVSAGMNSSFPITRVPRPSRNYSTYDNSQPIKHSPEYQRNVSRYFSTPVHTSFRGGEGFYDSTLADLTYYGSTDSSELSPFRTGTYVKAPVSSSPRRGRVPTRQMKTFADATYARAKPQNSLSHPANNSSFYNSKVMSPEMSMSGTNKGSYVQQANATYNAIQSGQGCERPNSAQLNRTYQVHQTSVRPRTVENQCSRGDYSAERPSDKFFDTLLELRSPRHGTVPINVEINVSCDERPLLVTSEDQYGYTSECNQLD